jgi:hypothetical protein
MEDRDRLQEKVVACTEHLEIAAYQLLERGWPAGPATRRRPRSPC